MNKQPAKTVGELIDILSKYDKNLPIIGVWESTSHEIADVIIDKGELLLDVDGGWLRDSIVRGNYK